MWFFFWLSEKDCSIRGQARKNVCAVRQQHEKLWLMCVDLQICVGLGKKQRILLPFPFYLYMVILLFSPSVC